MLSFLNSSDIVEFHSGFSFHLEASFAFAELHGLTGATRHVARAPCEENQRTDQQQWEEQVAENSQYWRRVAGWMHIKTDALLIDLAD